MVTIFKYAFLLMFLSIGVHNAQAEGIPTDKALHFGAGALATTIAYAWYREAFGMQPVPARLFALAAGTFVNAVGEAMDEKPEFDDFLAGQAGVGAAIGFTIIIEW